MLEKNTYDSRIIVHQYLNGTVKIEDKKKVQEEVINCLENSENIDKTFVIDNALVLLRILKLEIPYTYTIGKLIESKFITKEELNEIIETLEITSSVHNYQDSITIGRKNFA